MKKNPFYLTSKFKFHPVGQGLFDSGRIFSKVGFNFVLDCGVSFDKDHLFEEISFLKKNYY
jgi:hypothetical protein